MMKYIILVVLLGGCTMAVGPDGNMIRKSAGNFTYEFVPPCGIKGNSITLKGGPTISIEHADGVCKIDLRHNASLSELGALGLL